VGDDLVAADEQGDHEGEAEDEFERGPEHGHEADEVAGCGRCIPGWRVSKEAISASSWAKARMRRAPEKFSWALAEMSENMAWMRSKRRGCGAEVLHESEASGSGPKAQRVSLGLMWIMNGSAAAVKTMVLAEYMMAGPSSCGRR
jgi:hypothetical protein